MSIVDIHSHILPNIDDGAKDAQTSILLLRKLKEQGVTHVFATPHFIAQENSLDDFLKTREESYKTLLEAIGDEDLPKVYLGAEVYCFRGMGSSKELSKLKLGNTNLVLIELPNGYVTKSLLDDIGRINQNLGLVPVFAHIERYMGEKQFSELLKFIEKNDCYAQINGQSLLSFGLRQKMKKLIKKGYISFVASDTHSLTGRPPVLDRAFKILNKINSKMYEEISYDMDALAEELDRG